MDLAEAIGNKNLTPIPSIGGYDLTIDPMDLEAQLAHSLVLVRRRVSTFTKYVPGMRVLEAAAKAKVEAALGVTLTERDRYILKQNANSLGASFFTRHRDK